MQDWYPTAGTSTTSSGVVKWHISAFNSKGVPVPAAAPGGGLGAAHGLSPGARLARLTTRPGRAGRSTSARSGSATGPRPAPALQADLPPEGRDGQARDIQSSADVRRWLPGEDQWAEDDLNVDGLPPGDYELSLGIVTGHPGFPPLDLACEGQGKDGFVPVGRVRLGAQGGA